MAKRISKSRFDIYTIGTRTSGSILFQEISWWSDLDETVLGTVALDRTDDTYGWMILIRDEAGRFRCADLDHSFRSPRIAEAKLRIKIAAIVRADDFTGTYEQFDVDHKPLEFFTPHPEVKNQSPYFKILIDDDSRLPARIGSVYLVCFDQCLHSPRHFYFAFGLCDQKELAISRAGVKGQARRNGINGMREGLRVYAGNSLPDLSGTRQQASRLLPCTF